MRWLALKFQGIPQRTRTIVATCLFGLVASLGAVGFQLTINWLFWLGFKWSSHSSHFALISFAFITVGSLISGWLLNHFCPEAAGSGIPQLKLSFWKEFGHMPRRTAWVKF